MYILRWDKNKNLLNLNSHVDKSKLSALSPGHYISMLSVDLKIILKWISRKYDGGLDWIDMAHERDK